MSILLSFLKHHTHKSLQVIPWPVAYQWCPTLIVTLWSGCMPGTNSLWWPHSCLWILTFGWCPPWYRCWVDTPGPPSGWLPSPAALHPTRQVLLYECELLGHHIHWVTTLYAGVASLLLFTSGINCIRLGLPKSYMRLGKPHLKWGENPISNGEKPHLKWE